MTIYQLELVEFLHQKLFTRTAFSFALAHSENTPRISPAILSAGTDEPLLRHDHTAERTSHPVDRHHGSDLAGDLRILLLSFYHPLFIVMGSVPSSC